MVGFFVWGLMVVIDAPRTQSSYASIFTYGILVVYGVVFITVSCFAGSVHFWNCSNKRSSSSDNIDHLSNVASLENNKFPEKLSILRVGDNHSKLELNGKYGANLESKEPPTTSCITPTSNKNTSSISTPLSQKFLPALSTNMQGDDRTVDRIDKKSVYQFQCDFPESDILVNLNQICPNYNIKEEYTSILRTIREQSSPPDLLPPTYEVFTTIKA